MNYGWLFSRIALFFAVYFSIYAYSVIGGWAFVPFYGMLTVYFLVMGFIIIAVFALQSKMKEVVSKKPKDNMVSHTLYCVADLSMMLAIGFIYSFNGFPEVMPIMKIGLFLGVMGMAIGYWVNSWKRVA